MNSNNTTDKQNKQVRLMPGIIIAIIQWTLWFLIPKFSTGGTAMAVGVFGGIGCSVAILVWWAFFSRAPKADRWISIILMIIAVIIIPNFTDASIKTGLSGLMYYNYAIPVLCMSFVIWAVVSQYMSLSLKRITMVLTILIATGIWVVFRSEGITGNASAQFVWRWSLSTEELLLSENTETSGKFVEKKEINAYWPGFRGPNRDGIVNELKINTDWKNNPPVEMWRRQIGPGCSSFAVKGSFLYTQEQRGEDEAVSCYNLLTGEPVWLHSDKARFWDSHAGAGPRSTPTLHDSLLITLGATGILNVLNAEDGKVVWSVDASIVNDSIPGWGFASSPLVVDSVVIVAISGTLVAYDLNSGKQLWTGPKGGENYSSPQLVTIDGVKQVIMMSQVAATSFDPENGKIYWERPWNGGAIIQPAVTNDGDLLISEGYKKGIHRVSVSNTSENWEIKEKWMTTKIRPDFNDFTIHKGYLYGFEGLSITCIDLKDGSRKWKTGRYGGQLLLLSEQDLILILTEKGDLVLAEANPEKFTELAKIPAIEGKTWNHPVIVNNILVVRNTQEMAAYKLASK